MNGSHDPNPNPAASAVAPPAAHARIPDPRAKSPGLAGFLSIMPGLGQVYVGYYARGFVHLLVIASVLTILVNTNDEEPLPLLVLFLMFFFLYNIIDAIRRASMYNRYLEGTEEIDLPQDFQMPGIGGSIAGGLVLMVGGLLLLLNTRFDVSLDWIQEWWPLAPMLLGGYLFGKALLDRSS